MKMPTSHSAGPVMPHNTLVTPFFLLKNALTGSYLLVGAVKLNLYGSLVQFVLFSLVYIFLTELKLIEKDLFIGDM